MKFSVKCLFAAVAVSQTSAFQAPQSFGGRSFTKLAVTTLEDWQLLDNGSVVGSVKGHPSLNDGDVITTSPLSNPGAASTAAQVSTMTGSQYLLGTPMRLRPAGISRGSAVAEGGTLDRSTVIKGAGIAALIAGGFALGLGVGGGIGGSSQMTVPEVRIFELTVNDSLCVGLVLNWFTVIGKDRCFFSWFLEQRRFD